MLRIKINETELFDERTMTFRKVPGQTLKLEHSLISISKWEAKWHRPFISNGPKTAEEELDYIRCMSIGEEPDHGALMAVTMGQRKQISEYINDSMTATWFNNKHLPKGKGSGRAVTSELIYYWMTALQIPFECEKWHLNRLLTLIKICNIENAPQKKMSRQDNLAERRALNSARKSKYHTKG